MEIFLLSVTSDDRLLFLHSFRLADCGDGLFECESGVKLQLLRELSILDANHYSVSDHFIVQSFKAAVLSEVIERCYERLCGLIWFLTTTVELGALVDHVNGLRSGR